MGRTAASAKSRDAQHVLGDHAGVAVPGRTANVFAAAIRRAGSLSRYQFFRRAADAGLGVGATLLATIHDPVELQRLKVLGIIADPEEARRARELGAPKGSMPTSC